MAYIPNSGSVLAFQGTVPFSVLGQTTGSIISVQQGSVATVIVGGSIAASFTPPANQSVSGTVQTDVRGSVATVIIGGSIAASFTPPANQSVSGTVGASLIGLSPVSVSNFPTTQNVSGSVAAFVVGNASVITVSQGSVAVAIVSGSVAVTTGNSSVQVLNFPTNQSVSGAVSVSNFPTTQNVSGSAVAMEVMMLVITEVDHVPICAAATEPDIGNMPPAREETTVTWPEIELICVPP